MGRYQSHLWPTSPFNILTLFILFLTRKDTFRKHLKTHFLTIVLINYCIIYCFVCFIVLLLYGTSEHR